MEVFGVEGVLCFLLYCIISGHGAFDGVLESCGGYSFAKINLFWYPGTLFKRTRRSRMQVPRLAIGRYYFTLLYFA